MVMRLDPVLIAEAVGPMVTGGVAATLVVEAVDPGEEDGGVIKSPG